MYINKKAKKLKRNILRTSVKNKMQRYKKSSRTLKCLRYIYYWRYCCYLQLLKLTFKRKIHKVFFFFFWKCWESIILMKRMRISIDTRLLKKENDNIKHSNLKSEILSWQTINVYKILVVSSLSLIELK